MLHLGLATILCSLPCAVEGTTVDSEVLLKRAESWLQQNKWRQHQENRSQIQTQRSTSRLNKDKETTSFLGIDQASTSKEDNDNRRAAYVSKLKTPSSFIGRRIKSIKRAWVNAAGKYVRHSKDFPTKSGIIFFLTLWLLVLGLVWVSPIPLRLKRLHGDRIMSAIHSVIAGAGGIYVWVYQPPSCTLAYSDRLWIRLLVLVSVSYCIADMCSMVVVAVWKRWRHVDLLMILHHCFVICMYSWAAESHIALWFAASLLVNALSVAPLNLVQFLQYYGMKNSIAFKAAGIAFVLLFFWSRIVLIPWSAWLFHEKRYCHKELTWESNVVLLSYALVFSLNVWWFVKIGKEVQTTLGSPREKGKALRFAPSAEFVQSLQGEEFFDSEYVADIDEPAGVSQPPDRHRPMNPSGGD